MDKQGRVIWITGLSGAGKTTIGRALYEAWKPIEHSLVLLDGDELKNAFFQEIGYTLEERKSKTVSYANLSKMLSEQGINVIMCCIGLMEEVRTHNYAVIPNYTEIYVSAPMDILKQRDSKRIYNKETRNVWGVDLIPEYPKNPEIEILNDGSRTPAELAFYIMKQLRIQG